MLEGLNHSNVVGATIRIPTDNELRSSCAQSVGKEVFMAPVVGAVNVANVVDAHNGRHEWGPYNDGDCAVVLSV